MRSCIIALIAILGLCAFIAGAFCLGFAIIQLIFGTGRNIVMAYWGLSLIIVSPIVVKIVVQFDKD